MGLALTKESDESKVWQIKYPLLSEHTGVVYLPQDGRFIKSLLTELFQSHLLVQTFEQFDIGRKLQILTSDLSVEIVVQQCEEAEKKRQGTFLVELDCTNETVDLFEVFEHVNQAMTGKYPDHI